MKLFLSIAAIFGFLAVAIGAFGAHAIKDRIDAKMLDIYHTAVQYQMYHTLALIGVAFLIKFFPESRIFVLSGWFFTFGIIIFSGSLYALSLTGITKLGAITPIGGLCFLVAWAMLLVGATRVE
jgi:uncharacterized membrane protein YgdD (TMEM256/DUF423 family)